MYILHFSPCTFVSSLQESLDGLNRAEEEKGGRIPVSFHAGGGARGGRELPVGIPVRGLGWGWGRQDGGCRRRCSLPEMWGRAGDGPARDSEGGWVGELH